MVDRKTETVSPDYVSDETRTDEKRKTMTGKVSGLEPTDPELERIMSEATPEAEAARMRVLSKETSMETMRTGPTAGERTTRAGAAIGTEPATRLTTERPVTGVVVPPGTTTTTPMKPYGTVDEKSRMHAEDQDIHPDWEKQPQINAPRDVGIPTAEGQADAARIRAGQRRSDLAEEPRIDRRGGENDVPAASSAHRDVTDDRSVTEKIRDRARDVKEDVDRAI